MLFDIEAPSLNGMILNATLALLFYVCGHGFLFESSSIGNPQYAPEVWHQTPGTSCVYGRCRWLCRVFVKCLANLYVGAFFQLIIGLMGVLGLCNFFVTWRLDGVGFKFVYLHMVSFCMVVLLYDFLVVLCWLIIGCCEFILYEVIYFVFIFIFCEYDYCFSFVSFFNVSSFVYNYFLCLSLVSIFCSFFMILLFVFSLVIFVMALAVTPYL
jgi:hypothetical protein